MIFILKRYALINRHTYSCARTDLVCVCHQTLPPLSKGAAPPDYPRPSSTNVSAETLSSNVGRKKADKIYQS